MRLLAFYYALSFSAMGVSLPWFTAWLRSLGLSAGELGIVAATPAFLMALSTVSLGALADRANDWRSAIIGLNGISVLAALLLLSVQGFSDALLFWTLYMMLIMAVMPILDAATMRRARREGLPFHRIRASGSAGFIFGVMLAGWLIERHGIALFPYLLIGLGAMRFIGAFALPRFRAQDHLHPVAPPATPQIPATALFSVHSRWRRLLALDYPPFFLYTLSAIAVLQASHALFYGFGTLIWKARGISESQIGWLWSIGVGVEVLMMWFFTPLAARFSARSVISIAALLALLRWILFAQDPGFVALLWIQSLHGFTMGMLLLATVNFVANWTEENIAARAQALSATMNTTAVATSTVMASLIYEQLGVTAYWAMALICLLSLTLIWRSRQVQ